MHRVKWVKAGMILIVLFCFSPSSLRWAVAADEEAFHVPAEFEPHDFVWIVWTDEYYRAGEPTDRVVLRIIKALAPFVRIKLVVESRTQWRKVKRILGKHGISGKRVAYLIVPRNDRWIRDSGPIFLKGDRGRLKIADFNYNAYGELPTSDTYSKQVERLDRAIARQLRLPTVKTDLVSEGGGREFNGKGTLIVVESVELQRNPHKSKEEIERELLRVLGQKKVIWLKNGPAEDDKSSRGSLPGKIFTTTLTGGHIDEFCRFADANTILLAEASAEERDASPISRISYERLEESYRILSAATDQDGKPFTILRVPAADHLLARYKAAQHDVAYFRGIKAGDTIRYLLAASYLNFLVSNGVVLMPAYWKAGRPESIRAKDEKARRALQEAFPGRKIVPLDVEDVNHGGGGIHCITQQQPTVGNR